MKSARRKNQGSGRITGRGRAADNSDEFHATFSGQFMQRYADLFQALAQPVQHVALVNKLTDVNDCDEMGLISYYRHGPIACLRFPDPAAVYPPPPICPYTQLKQYYWMDFASVLPPLLLDVQPHHTVLDMCAAPGGKSLVLALQLLKGSTVGSKLTPLDKMHLPTANMLEQLAVQTSQEQQHRQCLQPETIDVLPLPPPPQQCQSQAGLEVRHNTAHDGDSESNSSSSSSGSPAATKHSRNAMQASSVHAGRLVCNELDPVRRQRLQDVLTSYLPGSLRRRVRVTGLDAAKHWARFEQGMYDRILLDAPCSSERHVVAQAIESGGVVAAGNWSREHCKQLAALQLQMLLAGLRALKPGGRLVYSTCSLAAVENDQVVQKALQKQQEVSDTAACAVHVVPVTDWGLSDIEQLAGGNGTEHGLLCLPDRNGWGPIYMAVFQKQPA